MECNGMILVDSGWGYADWSEANAVGVLWELISGVKFIKTGETGAVQGVASSGLMFMYDGVWQHAVQSPPN